MRHVFTSVGRAISWHRRGLAAVAAAIAVLALWSALRPSAPVSEEVVVARRTVTAGSTLTEADLEVRSLPASALPDQVARDPTPLLGRTSAATLTAGSILTEASVVAPRSHARPGALTAPVRARDPDVLALLRPGDRIDLLGTDGNGASTTIARGAVVVAVPRKPDDGGAFSSGSEQNLVLVEVSDTEAARIVALGGREVTIMLR